MKCVNCTKDALYEYKMTETKSVFYCDKDLPKFLEARKAAGLLTLTDKHAEDKASAIAAVTTPLVKDAPDETTIPPQKAVKKTAK